MLRQYRSSALPSHARCCANRADARARFFRIFQSLKNWASATNRCNSPLGSRSATRCSCCNRWVRSSRSSTNQPFPFTAGFTALGTSWMASSVMTMSSKSPGSSPNFLL